MYQRLRVPVSGPRPPVPWLLTVESFGLRRSQARQLWWALAAHPSPHCLSLRSAFLRLAAIANAQQMIATFESWVSPVVFCETLERTVQAYPGLRATVTQLHDAVLLETTKTGRWPLLVP